MSGACFEHANFEMNGNLFWSGEEPDNVRPAKADVHVVPASSDRAKSLYCDPPIILFLSILCHKASNPSPANWLFVLKNMADEDTVPLGVKYVELSCMPPKYSCAPGFLSAP